MSGMKTRIVGVEGSDLGTFEQRETLDEWKPSAATSDGILREAAERLRSHDIPVAFPTETVYGLGADATRSSAVKGIYHAKGRPSDNPLIIHVCDLTMLREILEPGYAEKVAAAPDPIPTIYRPLIQRFWPGPLTIILPSAAAAENKLAPEVSAGLPTFGARMPDAPLALSLISLVGRPLAAPSANTSTKPSPTTAQHVMHDLEGKIELILDGEACEIGLESTIVDGLCHPPVVLRPGGISLDSIRECSGWDKAVVADQGPTEMSCEVPRAPGMKYKHYSPQAQLTLYTPKVSSCDPTSPGPFKYGIKLACVIPPLKPPSSQPLNSPADPQPLPKVGIIRTKNWIPWAELVGIGVGPYEKNTPLFVGEVNNIQELSAAPNKYSIRHGELWEPQSTARSKTRKRADLLEVSLGSDVREIAHGLFAALRQLDSLHVETIHVEGIDDDQDLATAVMNRLRKAATTIK